MFIIVTARSFPISVNFRASQTSKWLPQYLSMAVIQSPYITALLLMCPMYCQLAAQPCRSEYSIRGMMLKRHTFKEMKTANWLKCLQRCNDDVRCQSFNYVITQDMCELNNRTKEASPEDFVRGEDRFYIKKFSERGLFVLNSIVNAYSYFLEESNTYLPG